MFRPKYEGVICGALLAMSLAYSPSSTLAQPATTGASISRMVLTSTAFADGAIIPDRYTQAVVSPSSPPLCWADAPSGTQSFALIVTDLDSAPQRSSTGVLHWMVFNIPGDTHCLAEAIPPLPILPDGTVQGKNFGGVVGYRGPGAPAGGAYHHYSFELYALNIVPAPGQEPSRPTLLATMDGHVLAKATLIGKFHK